MQTALPGQDCRLEHASVVHTPRTTPASTGRHELEKRPVQWESFAQVVRHAPSTHAVPVGQTPASLHEATHSCCEKVEPEKPYWHVSPVAQFQPSVHGSPWARSCGPASPPRAGSQFAEPPQLQLESSVNNGSARRVRIGRSYTAHGFLRIHERSLEGRGR